MTPVKQLRLFYHDLNSPDYHSAIGIVHSRFSTNTNPSWQRSHPNRMMVHNGEINTITGNVDKMLSRENILHCKALDAGGSRPPPARLPRGQRQGGSIFQISCPAHLLTQQTGQTMVV